MELGRRRLWLALVSATAFLLHRLIVELALGQGVVARHVSDGQPFARVIIAIVGLGVASLVVRDLRRDQQDWPVERLVAVLASLGLIIEVVRAATLGIATSPPLAALDGMARWASVVTGIAIWLPGKRP